MTGPMAFAEKMVLAVFGVKFYFYFFFSNPTLAMF